MIYLNHAAVAPRPERTRNAVAEFAERNSRYGAYHYPRWLRKEWELRSLLNASSDDDIALVKNTYEALSFVAYGLDWQTGDNIVTSNKKFPSYCLPWQSLAAHGVELREADLHCGATPEDALFALVDSRTRLLAISSLCAFA